MAFRQQPRLQTVRQQSFQTASTDDVQSLASSQQRKRTLQDSQEEWVLFSPNAPSVGTETISSERTPRTAGLSRLSEIASLDTAARSDLPDDVISEVQSDFVEDDGELDSLDDGLHAFHEPLDLGSPRQRMMRANETVLPSHDGQGSFGNLAQEATRQAAQPPKKQRRRSAVQKTLDALQEADEHDEEEQRNLRIEHWRLEQSRALLEEVERESARIRRMTRMASSRSVASSDFQTKSETDFSETEGQMTPLVMEEPEPELPEASVFTAIPAAPEKEPPENESFWKRLTRRVIRDLIGIDEHLLSVILGESLPEETQPKQTTPPQPVVQESYWPSLSWQERLLQRLARELGILVHQLSEHPGAFTAYLKTQEPIPYVGATLAHISAAQTDSSPGANTFLDSSVSHTSSILFPSTIRQANHNAIAPNADPSLWGIEEEPEEYNVDPVTAERLRKEREYWEQELDVGMVFNFLRARFSSNPYPEAFPPSPRPLESELATTPTSNTVGLAAATSNPITHPELLRLSGLPRLRPTSHPMPSTITPATAVAGPSGTHARAALIRAHHPLTAHVAPPARRNSGDQVVATAQSPTQNQAFSSPRRSLVAARRSNASSCASQSTKRSKLTSSGNYWDFTAEGPAGSISISGSRDGIST